MEDLLVQTIQINPGLMFFVMRPGVVPQGGFHPPAGQSTPPWCTCQKCRDMPTPVERVCCSKRLCVTETPVSCNFYSYNSSLATLSISQYIQK